MHALYNWIEVLAPIAMLPVVARTHRPYVALAWLAAIIVAPITASLACLYFGEFKFRRRRHRHQDVKERLNAATERLEKSHGSVPESVDEHELMGLVERVGAPCRGGWPAVGGNDVQLFDDTRACLDALVDDIDAAKHHVHLLFYLFAPDASGRRVGEALVRAAGRGVQCRLLAGDYSSRFETPRSFFRELAPELQRAGIRVEALRPINLWRNGMARIDLRNHRKLVVVDGRIAWVGSQNVHDPDLGLEEGVWHQLMARIHGPGALHVQTVFLDDWCRETGECPDPEVLLPEPDHPGDVTLQTLWWGPDDTHPSYVRTLLALIGNARERIDVCSPYFVPDEPIHLALQVAAERGVEVNVILPMKSDKFYVDAAARAGFDALLEAGVRIHRHRGGVLHAKSVSVDDALALVGSGNCDQRSFYLDYELAILIYDAAIAKRVRDIHEGYLADSERVDLEAWKQRSEWRVTADRMLALLSPLL